MPPRSKPAKNGPVQSIRPGPMLKAELDRMEVDWLAVTIVSAEEAIVYNSREQRTAILKARRRRSR